MKTGNQKLYLMNMLKHYCHACMMISFRQRKMHLIQALLRSYEKHSSLNSKMKGNFVIPRIELICWKSKFAIEPHISLKELSINFLWSESSRYTPFRGFIIIQMIVSFLPEYSEYQYGQFLPDFFSLILFARY